MKKMLCELFFISLLIIISGQAALAADVNRATKSELQTIKGIGRVMAEKIILERQQAGPFVSWQDLSQRVSGMGSKRLERLKQQGLRLHALPRTSALP